MSDDMHIGRSWSGSPLEDACPCPKAPCGLVIASQLAPGCAQHAPEQTIRQSHKATDCPGRPNDDDNQESMCGCGASFGGAPCPCPHGAPLCGPCSACGRTA